MPTDIRSKLSEKGSETLRLAEIRNFPDAVARPCAGNAGC
jgi:hypothetical protein